MTDRTQCPRCAVVGFNRVEHVIRAGHSYRSYACQACGHGWQVIETGKHVPTGDDDAPDRSRTLQLPDRRSGTTDRRTQTRSDRRKRR